MGGPRISGRVRDDPVDAERHAAVGAFDAVLCAVALEAGADALVSADRAFADVPGVHHVIPDDAGITRLLG